MTDDTDAITNNTKGDANITISDINGDQSKAKLLIEGEDTKQ